MKSEEFEALYAATFRRIAIQVYAMTGNLEEPAECVKEASARAWAKRRTLERVSNPEAWIRSTAYRLAVSRWRRGERPRDRAVRAATECRR